MPISLPGDAGLPIVVGILLFTLYHLPQYPRRLIAIVFCKFVYNLCLKVWIVVRKAKYVTTSYGLQVFSSLVEAPNRYLSPWANHTLE